MGVLMLRCPMTDRNFSTGINTDRDRFRLIPDAMSAARCPYCRLDHIWRPRDAWLMESFPPGELVENRVPSVTETVPPQLAI
jgi:hypothetical protein